MRVIRHLRREGRRAGPIALTLGNFDGVHVGHQTIIRAAVAQARALGGESVAVTFEPHPMAVLAPARAPALLQSLADRLAVFRQLGLDLVVLQRFTRAFAALEPEAFVRDFLLSRLDLRHVVVGYNVNFGRGRSGNVDTLRTLGAVCGFTVDIVGPVTEGGTKVSSTALRRVLREGDVGQALRFLGRPYTLRGRVVAGERRGRLLGFPTANLHVRSRMLLPADGVYAIAATVDGRRVAGVLNIGVRPTFGEQRHTIEAHLLDWSGELYGRLLTVALLERLRDERAFGSPAALREAIAADVARARVVVAAHDPGA